MLGVLCQTIKLCTLYINFFGKLKIMTKNIPRCALDVLLAKLVLETFGEVKFPELPRKLVVNEIISCSIVGHFKGWETRKGV